MTNLLDFDHLTVYDIPEKTIALVQNPDEDEDGKVENSSTNSRWNPSDLVSKMYKLQAIASNQVNHLSLNNNLQQQFNYYIDFFYRKMIKMMMPT